MRLKVQLWLRTVVGNTGIPTHQLKWKKDLGLLKSPIAQALQVQSSVQDFIICIEMGIAYVVHLYVFPAKPYELMEEQFPGSVSVLGDYVGDLPVDPDEVRDSERPTKLHIQYGM